MLRSLGGPSLDAREARLPFARETVRYEPTAIQRRFRDVSCDMTPAETLEAGGAVALGNAICRLSIVLDA